MKKIYFLLSTALLLCFCLNVGWAQTTEPAPDPANIILNGEFNSFSVPTAEDDYPAWKRKKLTDGDPAVNGGWTGGFTGDEKDDIIFDIDETGKLSGDNSLHIIVNTAVSTNPDDYFWDNGDYWGFFEAQEGVTYEFSFDVVASEAVTFRVAMNEHDWGTDGDDFSIPVAATTVPQTISVETTSPVSVTQMHKIFFANFPPTETGYEVWIDNVRLTPVVEEEEPTPNAAVAVWTLNKSGSSAVTTGSATANDETLSSKLTFDAANNGAEGSMRIQVTADVAEGTSNGWPTGQTDTIPGVYAQFAVTPTLGKALTVESIAYTFAARSLNNLKAKFYYSTDPNFGTKTLIPNATGLDNDVVPRDEADGQPARLYPIELTDINATVNPDETFYFRIYPWVNNEAEIKTGKYLLLGTVTISGTTSGGLPECVDENGEPLATAYHRVDATGSNWNGGITDITIDPGQSIEFGPQPNAGYTWTWTGPNGWTFDGRSPLVENFTEEMEGEYVAVVQSATCVSTITYNVTVNNEVAEPTADVTLSDLQIDGAIIAGFDPMATDYHVILPTGTTSVELTATAADGNATADAPETVDVTSGTATAEIVVTNGTDTETYQVHFTVVPETNPNAKTIVLVTPTEPADSYKDNEQRAWLIRKGFNVPVYYNASLSTASSEDVAMLNAADLVIIGRGPASSAFEIAANKTAWNNLSVPVILNSMYIARNNRLNWFNTTTITKTNPDVEEFIVAEVTDSSLPVFSGVEIGEDNLLPWSNTPDETLVWADATTSNGTILATSVAPENGMLFVRFAAGTEFYTGAVDAPAGERTYFGFGNDNNTAYADNYFPLTTEGRTVYLAEINRLAEVDLTDATLSAIMIDGEAVADFDPATFTYDVVLPAGTTTVAVNATPAVGQATLAGTGDVDVSSGSGTSTLVVTSADGSATNEYEVNFTMEEASNDASLSAITLTEGSIEFDAATTTYNVALPTGTQSVTVGATATDDNATVAMTPADGIVDVSSGSGTATITVTAEDGTTTSEVYTINFTAPTSVAGLASQGVKIYPNPVNGSTILNLSNAADLVSVNVYTAQGVLVKTISTNNSGSISIQVSDLAEGLYLLKAVNKDRSVLTGKFVK